MSRLCVGVSVYVGGRGGGERKLRVVSSGISQPKNTGLITAILGVAGIYKGSFRALVEV